MLNEITNNIQSKGGMIAIVLSIIAIFFSGIFFGGTYYLFDTLDDSLHGIDCTIENNAYFNTCQDWFDMAIYPFLGLRDIIIWFSYFFIFALVLGMFVMSYKSGRSPAMMPVLILTTILFAYLGIELSNAYRTMLENPLFFSMMTPFNIYNKIILNFPWFIGVIGLITSGISIVNYQKVKPNSGDLDY
jgi:hypothetical protein